MRKLLLGLSGAVLTAMTLASCFGDEFSNACENTLKCPDGTSGSAGSGSGGDTSTGSTSSTGSNGGAASTCDPECTGSKSVCDKGKCVQCTEDDDSACDDDTPVCDPVERKCVECLTNAGCEDPAKSFCDDGTCSKCNDATAGTQCAHLEDTPACDTEEGTCVECTVEDESKCGTKSCNPETHECTDTERGSRGACQSCVADSECEEDYRCVKMNFQTAPRNGGHCLKIASTGCVKPFTVPTSTRPSLSGAIPEPYCGVDESVTTCEAVQDIKNDVGCTTDDDCGAQDLDDAQCKTVNFVALRCTYRCGATAQCPSGYGCAGPSGSEYCGGPM